MNELKIKPIVQQLGLIVSLTIILVTSAQAQVCRTRITPPTISAATFVLGATALSIETGLEWQRCIYGQTWEPDRQACEGSPIILTWVEALQVAANDNLRLPNIKELNSILDLQCINPPYSLKVFPDTFASGAYGLWTSSPHIEASSKSGDKTKAWYIGLSHGKLDYRDIDLKNFARFLVK